MKVIHTVTNYSKMIKLSHSLFALPFAGIGFLQALHEPITFSMPLSWVTGLIIVCMVAARSAAMGMNRLADRFYDAQNPRTINREIPSGKISPTAVVIFIVISSVIFILSSLALNWLSFYLSFLALAILFLYSFSKRFTWFCHFILGISIGFAPLGAWIGVHGAFAWIPVLWFLGLLFQIAGFDILYSIQDMEIDRKLGLFSIPSRWGNQKAYRFSFLSLLLAVILFISAGVVSDFSWKYYTLLVITAGILIFEFRIARLNESKVLPPLFYLLNSWVGILLFIGVLIELGPELMEKYI